MTNWFMKLGIVSCLISLVLVSISCSQTRDDKAIFMDRLDKFANAPSGPGFTASKQEITARKNLLSFTKEFPRSNFADDAQFVSVVFTAGYPSDEDVSIMEKLIEDYPDGKIEYYTIQYLENYCHRLGIDPPARIYMPYDVVLLYMKCENAWRNKNWDAGIKYSSEFLKKVDANDPRMRIEVYADYADLLYGYKILDRTAEGEEAKNKMISVFPDKKDQIERIWSSPVPQYRRD
jgi:hypothetical protein